MLVSVGCLLQKNSFKILRHGETFVSATVRQFVLYQRWCFSKTTSTTTLSRLHHGQVGCQQRWYSQTMTMWYHGVGCQPRWYPQNMWSHEHGVGCQPRWYHGVGCQPRWYHGVGCQPRWYHGVGCQPSPRWYHGVSCQPRWYSRILWYHGVCCLRTGLELCGRRKCSQSAVYISAYDDTEDAVVDPDLDLETRFSDLVELNDNIKRREMDFDLQKLQNNFKTWKALGKEKTQLETKRQAIIDAMKVLVTLDSCAAVEQKKADLKLQGKEVRKQLHKLSKQFAQLERRVMIQGLQLPVSLNHTAGCRDMVMKEAGDRAAGLVDIFEEEDHKRLGRRLQSLALSTISPNAYYLSSELAELELRVTDWTSHFLQERDLQQLSCPDMVKSPVLEACGLNTQDGHQTFLLKPKARNEESCDDHDGNTAHTLINQLHLTGVSLASFIAMFTRMNISSSCLPLKLFSVGRKYCPDAHVGLGLTRPNGLLGVPQATVVDFFGLASCRVQAEELYTEFGHILWSLYQQLEMPVKLIGCSANKLQRVEACRQEVRIKFPSQQKDVTVGHVSLYQDHLARCLNISHHHDPHNSYNRNYVFTVHGTVVCVPTLLAAILENNTLKAGQVVVPKCLHPVRQNIPL